MTIFGWGYKPTYNWRAPSCIHDTLKIMIMGIYMGFWVYIFIYIYILSYGYIWEYEYGDQVKRLKNTKWVFNGF